MRNKKKIKTLFRLTVAVCMIVVVSGLASYHVRRNVTPVILAMSRSDIESQTVNAVNSAAHIVIAADLEYSDLVDVVYDGMGNVQLISPNSVKLNRLARDLQNVSQNNVEMISEQYVYVPVGAFSGSILLSGIGPEIPVRMLPIGSVSSEYYSIFENVGINQTRHAIYVNVKANVSLVLPIYSETVEAVVSVLVCENVIMGKIPDVYVNGENEKDYLDLIG